eukprot:2763529-Amphidinium_carterae.3
MNFLDWLWPHSGLVKLTHFYIEHLAFVIGGLEVVIGSHFESHFKVIRVTRDDSLDGLCANQLFSLTSALTETVTQTLAVGFWNDALPIQTLRICLSTGSGDKSLMNNDHD